MKLFLAILAIVCGLFLSNIATAHEVRPAYLGIEQTSPNSFKITWKQPTLGDVSIHLVPHLSNGWLEAPPSDQYMAAGFLIRTWIVKNEKPAALAGQSVTIEGLEETITDVFVRIRLTDGKKLDTIVRPENPAFKIAVQSGSAISMPSFLSLGIEHILSGPDHLLFVLGLILIVRDRYALLKTVSAFTVAHSITLATATLVDISLPVPLLNALIALSILFIAPEAIRAQRGEESFTTRYPWVVAFAFGLLHGMGFASGLTTLGLEKSALLAALVLFNIGVEIGQLTFIAVVLLLSRSFRLMEIRWSPAATLAPTYAIGVIGASMTIQYSAILFGVL